MTKNTGGLQLSACTSADVENNSLFLDSTDDRIKMKNNSGSVVNI